MRDDSQQSGLPPKADAEPHFECRFNTVTTAEPDARISNVEPAKLNAGMFSSATDDWATPPDTFAYYHGIYSFTLDVCASDTNAKCARYFTKDDDGLAKQWAPERCWMNPPYGTTIGAWMRKAYEESRQGALVVCLVPARTDTAWWHDYAARGHVEFIRGRLAFGAATNSAPFPSAVVTFLPARVPELFA